MVATLVDCEKLQAHANAVRIRSDSMYNLKALRTWKETALMHTAHSWGHKITMYTTPTMSAGKEGINNTNKITMYART